MNEDKRIVLLTGLQCISYCNFRIVKSLLIHGLQLTKKMQDDCDRIKIADLMEAKFQKDAGLSILIELDREIPELGDLDTLRKEMVEGNGGAPLMCSLSLPSSALLDPCSVYS